VTVMLSRRLPVEGQGVTVPFFSGINSITELLRGAWLSACDGRDILTREPLA
jgi:hypothetical protein